MVLFHTEFGDNRIVPNKWVDGRNKTCKKGICNKWNSRLPSNQTTHDWVLPVKMLGKIKFGYEILRRKKGWVEWRERKEVGMESMMRKKGAMIPSLSFCFLLSVKTSTFPNQELETCFQTLPHVPGAGAGDAGTEQNCSWLLWSMVDMIIMGSNSVQ